MKKKLIVIMGLIIIGLTACNSDEEKAVMNMVENTKIAESTAEDESTAEQESTGAEEYSTDESSMDENEIPTTASDPTPETEEIEQTGYTVEEIDKKMYVKEWCSTYMGPNEQAYELFGECNKGELVHLTGQVKEESNESNWYEYEAETGDKGFISGNYLVTDNPVKQETAQKPSTPEQTQTPQPEQTTGTPNTTDANGVVYNEYGEPININPKTGEVMKPGDSWVNDAGVKTTYLEDF